MVLELREASPDQVELLWTANYTSWGGPLDLQAYFERERLLAQTSLLSNGGITFWILVDSPSNTPLCACETYNRKKGLVKIPGKPLEEVCVIGVASVFTPEQNRRKGYAGTMMRLLGERMASLTSGRGFSVLYSDVGPTFYAENGGWKSFDAEELVIPKTMTFTEIAPVEMLDLELAKECIDEDVRLLREEILTLADTSTIIQMIPQYIELEWAITRDRHAARRLGEQELIPVGARYKSDEGWGYILWFRDFKYKSLTVLRLREPRSISGLKGLLQATVEIADKFKFGKITIWSPSKELEKATEIQKVVREGAIPGMLWIGEEKDVHWRTIEKLGWC